MTHNNLCLALRTVAAGGFACALAYVLAGHYWLAMGGVWAGTMALAVMPKR